MSDDGIFKSLKNLLPDPSAAFSGDTHALIVVVFVTLICVIAGSALVYTGYQYRSAKNAVEAVIRMLDGVPQDELANVRSELLAKSESLPTTSEVGALWREFDETLVESDGKLWNTVEADHYFNTERLAPRLVANRLLTAAPAVLTAVGLLGTFIGLATGLNSLDLSESATVEQMRSGIEGLVAGAGLGFTASVWGVFFSLVVNVVEKLAERRVAVRTARLQARIDELFVLHSPEQSFVMIEKHTGDSADALNALHEKIGTQLQEAVAGISQEMQDALTRAIETSMAPSMASLAENTATQSAEVFEKLVDKFANAFQSIGTRQAEQLGAASSTLDSTLGSVTTEVGSAILSLTESAAAQSTATSEQAEAFRAQLAELSELATRQSRLLDGSLRAITLSLESAATTMGAATTSLDASSATLQGTAQTFAQTGERFDSSLQAGTRALEETAEAHARGAAVLDKQTAALGEINAASLDATERLTRAATTAGSAFDTMRAHQETFLTSLKAQVDNHSASLKDWLDQYSDQVHHQTSQRMNEWNNHTREFASHMLSTSNALAEVIDEMEVRIGAQDPGKSSLS